MSKGQRVEVSRKPRWVYTGKEEEREFTLDPPRLRAHKAELTLWEKGNEGTGTELQLQG